MRARMGNGLETDGAKNPQAPRGEQERFEIAGEWLLRLESDDLDQQDINVWLEWYSADKANRAAFDELQAQYERLRAAPTEQRRQLTDAINAVAAVRPQQFARVRRYGLAVAAMLIATVCGAFLALSQRNETPSTAAMYTTAYRTPRAGLEEIKLPDGSIVRIGAMSSVSLSFTQAARYLVLEGEASFQVAHDPARPFIVQAGALTVKAVGTAFNIRRAKERIVVTVSEGAVDVAQEGTHSAQTLQTLLQSSAAAAPAMRVTAGQQVKVDARNAPLSVTSVDAGAAVAWQSGRLEFVNEPLAAVIASVNRYSAREIIVEDEVAEIRYTGTVLQDRIDEWLSALQSAFPVQLETFGSKTLIGSASAAGPVQTFSEERAEEK